MESPRRVKILFVDDEPDLRDIVSEEIGRAGFDCIHVGSVPGALKLLNDQYFDVALVLSDLKMKKADGLQLREQMIASGWESIPFVLMSGFITPGITARLEGLKVAAALDKPYDRAKLLEVVHRASALRIEAIREERELLDGFVGEARGIIENLERLILDLDAVDEYADHINRIYGLVHTLKGSSGFFTPPTLHQFAHRYEDYLSKLKSGKLAVSGSAVTTLLKGFDVLRELLGLLERHQGDGYDLKPVLSLLEGAHAAAAAETAAPEAPRREPAAPASADARPAESSEVRVATGLLDELMDLSGEVTVFRSMVKKSLKGLERSYPADRHVTQLTELLEEMHEVHGVIQTRMDDLRKQPIKTVLLPLPRAVRDMTAQLQKEVRLDFEGEDLRVPQSIAQALSGPLLHMVRNSVDHAVEMPAVREAAGKPRQGRVSIRFTRAGERIVVQVTDDGKGIDADAIRRKAVEKKIVSESEAAALGEADVLALIFAAGFSTAERVTEISGRGVGMDVVKKAIDQVDGTIEIESKVGLGTTFTLRIPIPKSVLIANTLLVRCGDESYGIEEDRIIRVIELDPGRRDAEVERVGEGEILRREGRLFPLISLPAVLSLEPAAAPLTHLALVRSACGDFGLLVDAISDLEEVVIKGLSPHLRGIQTYSGATFLGDGAIGLILDVDGVASAAGLRDRDVAVRRARGVTQNTEPKIEGILEFRIAGSEAVFGLPMAEIFRIETVAAQRFQFSGLRKVLNYRGRAMPIYGFRERWGLATPAAAERAEVPLILIERGDGLIAFEIAEILDIAYPAIAEVSPVRSSHYYAGSAIVRDRVVTLIDLEATLRAA